MHTYLCYIGLSLLHGPFIVRVISNKSKVKILQQQKTNFKTHWINHRRRFPPFPWFRTGWGTTTTQSCKTEQ